MGEPFKITVCELNVQGEIWKKKEKDQISKQIKSIFEKLKNAPAEMEQRRQGISKSLDVIVLTAVCNKQCEIIQDELNEYEWGASKIVNKYSVVIGVNKSFDDFKLIEVTSDISTRDIDLLKVRFEVKGQFFTVIGCRFTTGIDKDKLIVNKVSASEEGGYSTVNAKYRKSEIKVKVMHEVCEKLKINTGDNIYCELIKRENGEWVAPFGFTTEAQEMKKQYDSECVAFCSTLLPFIHKSIDDNKNDVFILAGDFNNARCHGDLDSVGDYTYRHQINFNLHLIKDWLKPYGFEMADIRKDETGRKKPIPTFHKKFPIDHIFVRGLTLGDNVCKTITDDDLSDHAIIWAEFESDMNVE